MMAAMTDRRLLPSLFATLSLSLACNLPGGILAPSTATPTTIPTATATPTPTPTPTPQPADRMERGEWALFVGDWSAAMDHFQAARVAAEDQEKSGSAQLGIGRAHLRAGRLDEAEAALTIYLQEFPQHAEVAEGYFLRGLARELNDQLDSALADYQRFLESDPRGIESFARERMGDLERQAERPLAAIPQYRAAVETPRLGSNLGVQIKIGRAYMEAEEYALAVEEFEALYAAASDPATKAAANLLAGRALESMGEDEAAYAKYLDSVERFPTLYDTYLALVELVEAGVSVDDYLRGFIDYQAGAYEPALRAFNRAEVISPSADLYYYRGLTLRALGDYAGSVADFDVIITGYPESERWADAWFAKARTQWLYADQLTAAEATYLRFVEVAPEHARAPEALFLAGDVAERAGGLGRAGDIWLRLVESYPSAVQRHEAAFAAGIVRFREGRHSEAESAFSRAAVLGADGEQRAAGTFWVGKARQAVGDMAGAREAWSRAAQEDPTGYYSERAEDLLVERAPFESTGVFDSSEEREAARQEAEQWLRQQFSVTGPEPLTDLTEELAKDARIIRGETFWRLGLFDLAKAEFEALRSELAGDPEATYRLMHKLLDLGLYRPAIFAARSILDNAGLDDAGTMAAPRYFNLIRFGSYYGDLILPAAAEHELHPLFLLSVVRQESLFEGFATSYAAARGLMQVIPTTGDEIAGQLGWPPDYRADDLYRPVVSVRFGAHYLARQRDLFEGALVPALAAYNAGPGNALAWRELAPEDPDLFVEVMRIEQPQIYVRSIYEVYRIYQRLYIE